MLFSILSNTLCRRNSLENLAVRTCQFLINPHFPQLSAAQVETYRPLWCYKQKQWGSHSTEREVWVQMDTGPSTDFQGKCKCAHSKACLDQWGNKVLVPNKKSLPTSSLMLLNFGLLSRLNKIPLRYSAGMMGFWKRLCLFIYIYICNFPLNFWKLIIK